MNIVIKATWQDGKMSNVKCLSEVTSDGDFYYWKADKAAALRYDTLNEAQATAEDAWKHKADDEIIFAAVEA